VALSAYVKFDGIPGECSEDGHKDWVQVTQFNHQAEQKASPSQVDAGGPASAKTEHCAIRLTKAVDKTSPILWERLSSGGVIPEVTIEMTRPDKSGATAKIWEVKLDTVLVSRLQLDGSDNTDDIPSETVELKYGKIKWTYHVQDRTGTVGGAVPAGWDLIANKKWS